MEVPAEMWISLKSCRWDIQEIWMVLLRVLDVDISALLLLDGQFSHHKLLSHAECLPFGNEPRTPERHKSTKEVFSLKIMSNTYYY
ncbi:hypothetical protein JTE90_024675 [Oedothorax gibbosus]|uniref:Uncharacterized protein n=1 Tax=Oedothorax gibbosus TaxID=931172 RepID=A0AAV6TXI2_9ARAC|nr:hypothetical protein JTE90_024675 [Oedothorax gibbosus]